MLKKMKKTVVFSFVVSVFVILCTVFASCFNNTLTNTTWKDGNGSRTLTFTESTFRWEREDTDRDLMGTYTISKDSVILSFDDGDRYTGSFIRGIFSFTANPGKLDESHVEFHRVQ